MTTAELRPIDELEWLEDPLAEQRRRLRTSLGLSIALHLCVVWLLYLSPAPSPYALPPAITVDLVAALPAPAAPRPPAAKPPAPAPVAVPKPPPPKPQVKILPKEAPPVTAKPRVEPKPKPAPEPVAQRPPRPQELTYDDALAQLREQLGESEPVAPAPQAAKVEASAPADSSASTTGSPTGIRVSPEVAAWNLAVKRHIRSVWVNPADFREPGFSTEVRIQVAADGSVIGQPKVVRSSGNPFYDDNAIRAIVKSSPLPPPPAAGSRTIIFTPEE